MAPSVAAYGLASFLALVYNLTFASASVSAELAAVELLDAWKVGTSLQIVSAAEAVSREEAVEGASDAIVLAILGEHAPPKRTSKEPFVLAIDGDKWNASALSDLLALDALNAGARVIDGLRGRFLSPFRLKPNCPELASKPLDRGPHAIWDVSTGEVCLDERVLDTIASSGSRVTRVLGPFATALFHQLSRLVELHDRPEAQGGLRWELWTTKAVPMALAAAIGAQVPLWFCIACPIVLGLLAPLVFNAGFGAAADMICQHYKLQAEECNDLWYGAFALAMILSLASVIPIVNICQLRACARPE